MSFLTRSKPSIPDSPSRFGSKTENKGRAFTQASASRSRDDIMGNLQIFRDDLRKQISDKMSKNSRQLDVSSPRGPTDFKSLLTSKNEASSSFQVNSYNGGLTASFTTKGRQSPLNMTRHLNRRVEEVSPRSKSPLAKDLDLLSQISKKKESQRFSAFINLGTSYVNKSPNGNRSPNRHGVSPRRGGSPIKENSILDVRPLDYFKREVQQKSFLQAPRTSLLAAKQQDFKEDIKHILDSGRTPKLKKDFNNSRVDSGDHSPKLSRQVSLLRSNRTGLNDVTANLFSGLYQRSDDNLKNGYSRTRQSHGNSPGLGINLHKEESESNRRKGVIELKSLSLVSPGNRLLNPQDTSSTLRVESRRNEKEKLISDKLPLSHIFEVQDLFYNATDRGFDQLSPE